MQCPKCGNTDEDLMANVSTFTDEEDKYICCADHCHYEFNRMEGINASSKDYSKTKARRPKGFVQRLFSWINCSDKSA